jgi:ELWxxDGT repeat protein
LTSDPTAGIELWKSDGTASGTVVVKVISHETSSPGPPAGFVECMRKIPVAKAVLSFSRGSGCKSHVRVKI